MATGFDAGTLIQLANSPFAMALLGPTFPMNKVMGLVATFSSLRGAAEHPLRDAAPAVIKEARDRLEAAFGHKGTIVFEAVLAAGKPPVALVSDPDFLAMVTASLLGDDNRETTTDSREERQQSLLPDHF
jgi:hypothetical protein